MKKPTGKKQKTASPPARDLMAKLKRQSATGQVVATGIKHADPSILVGLEEDLQRARIGLAASWPDSRISIVRAAKKSWDELQAEKLLGTLKRRAEVQLGVCAGYVEATAEAIASRPDWHSFATLAAISIIRLLGAIDAVVLTRDTLMAPRIEKAKDARKKMGRETREQLRRAAIQVKKLNPRVSRNSAAKHIVDRGLCSVKLRQARGLLSKIFTRTEWENI